MLKIYKSQGDNRESAMAMRERESERVALSQLYSLYYQNQVRNSLPGQRVILLADSSIGRKNDRRKPTEYTGCFRCGMRPDASASGRRI